MVLEVKKWVLIMFFLLSFSQLFSEVSVLMSTSLSRQSIRVVSNLDEVHVGNGSGIKSNFLF